MYLPEKIQKYIVGESYKTDTIGMSGSSVFLYKERVLKVQDVNGEAENEYHMLQFLQGRLPVPRVYAYEIENGKSYMLMDRMTGLMACAREYMENPVMQCKMLADGLKKLWQTDIIGCPSDQRLKNKLERAKYNVENGLVDLENAESGTFGERGFGSPENLLEWLYDNKPEEEPVLSHGDYCLPNLFGRKEQTTGYIDLTRAGVADKWCDIALCCRSLSENGLQGNRMDGDFAGLECNSVGLFRELGIEPDWGKIRYYILLDELF